MSNGYHIVVCGSLVPDPLQTLIPVMGPNGPGLKNEMMLPVVLDPWAGHSLYEAGHLAKNNPGSKIWLVSIGPKAKLQQLMMAIAQKLPFELVVLDGPAGGFVDGQKTGQALAEAIKELPGLEMEKLLLFGGCSSATRDAGITMQVVAEQLGIPNQFTAVDVLTPHSDHFEIHERIEGGEYLVSKFTRLPASVAWATGSLPEPPNNPQVGMMNMRTIMPAIQRAKPATVQQGDLQYHSVEVPQSQRETQILKDLSADEIARELAEWIKA